VLVMVATRCSYFQLASRALGCIPMLLAGKRKRYFQ